MDVIVLEEDEVAVLELVCVAVDVEVLVCVEEEVGVLVCVDEDVDVLEGVIVFEGVVGIAHHNNL